MSIDVRLVRHLWSFLAVAEELHFGRAARRLGISQPPLTEQIKTLEQSLRIRLFDRDRRGVRLTRAGSAVLPAVQAFAGQLARLELAVAEAARGQVGTLAVGAITGAMLDTLPPLLARLRAEHPRLTVSVREIDSAEAVPALEAGEIDLAFARLEGVLGPSIRSLPVTSDRLVVALPRDHKLAAEPRVALAALAAETFVCFSRRISPVYFDALTAACGARGFSPRILQEVRSVTAQVAFVACGQGVALVPRGLRRGAPREVAFRPLAERIEVVTTAVAWNAARANPAVDAMLDLVREADR